MLQMGIRRLYMLEVRRNGLPENRRRELRLVLVALELLQLSPLRGRKPTLSFE